MNKLVLSKRQYDIYSSMNCFCIREVSSRFAGAKSVSVFTGNDGMERIIPSKLHCGKEREIKVCLLEMHPDSCVKGVNVLIRMQQSVIAQEKLKSVHVNPDFETDFSEIDIGREYSSSTQLQG